jgi:outer membrane receptor protein involved in Fe transport
MFKAKPVTIVLAVGIAMPMGSAIGQQAPAQADLQGVAQLEEVIVSARKRNESLLETPVSETVFSQQDMEQYQTNSLSTLKDQVPGLLMGASVNEVGTQLSIRGIGTTVMNATMDQSVTLNIDGLPISQGLAYQAGIFDLGQAEVLKGPQALYYGKNSPAGVIALRSADPTDKVEVIARAGYEFESENRVGELILSGPVTPDLKFRLAARFSDSEGYFRNVAVAIPGLGGETPSIRNVAPDQNWILRGTVLFDPNSTYSASLKLNFTNDSVLGTGGPLQVTSCPGGTSGVPPVNIPFLQGSACQTSRNFAYAWYDPAAFPGIPHDGVPYARSTQGFGSLTQNLTVSPGLSLTSVTGFYGNWYRTLFNADTAATSVTVGEDNSFYNRQFTQELRLTSDYTTPVNFMVGAFFQNGSMYNRVFIPANTALELPPELNAVAHYVDIHSYSGFGQATWSIIKQLELSAGVRWTDEHRSHEEYNFNSLNGPLGLVPLTDSTLSESNLSPEVSLTYKPSKQLTLYGAYKQGFKSGSFDAINYVPPGEPSRFNGERVKGGEVGLKALLLDNHLAVNFDAYRYDYSNLQVGANVLAQQPGANGPTYVFESITINAASALVQGIDLDATYSIPWVSGLTLRGAMNYNDAYYNKFPNAPCGNAQTIAQGCNQLLNPTTGLYGAQDLSGRTLVRAPLWSGNAGFNYNRNLAHETALVVGANIDYTDRYMTVLPDLPGFYQGSFVKFDANVTFKGPQDAWEVALVGNNIGNRLTEAWCANSNVRNGTILGGQISGGTTTGPAGPDQNACSLDPPREVWLRLMVRVDSFFK